MTQADSEDTTNETISTTPITGNGNTSLIWASYAAQIQAVRDEVEANLLSAGYSNLASIYSDEDTTANSLFSTLLSSG